MQLRDSQMEETHGTRLGAAGGEELPYPPRCTTSPGTSTVHQPNPVGLGLLWRLQSWAWLIKSPPQGLPSPEVEGGC